MSRYNVNIFYINMDTQTPLTMNADELKLTDTTFKILPIFEKSLRKHCD